MPKSERDEVLGALTARVFQAMLEELVMDAALQSHQEVARSRTLCPVCKTRPAAFAPGTSRGGTPSSAASADVPLARATANGSGTATPTGARSDGGNLLLECVSCSRQIASNRYAPHLSSCMGLPGARRGAVRASNVKSKPASDAGRSASPLSDAGYASDDAKGATKGKGKPKAAKGDEADFALKRKRLGSPQISPNKKVKKGKPSGSPVSRVKADPDPSGLPSSTHYPPAGAHPKAPSKLRDSSTASFLDRSSSASRASSPMDGGTPASSFASQSPARPLAVNGRGGAAARGRPHALGTGPPKRPTPPRPPPVHVPDYHMEIDHANETGSSTDTDSD
ncbi:hypothetical protein HYPSUDRAFT_64202 [Hypholoma sublateritium FD-334 SS-4]|uniref:SAGA-associated factor 11 n=1 Tax=Hypholoma sublateritium (strain FD-334 SS-4) TaxID=945553 RepID=A0A0D2LEM1_HYPSF|nr:hypothetical protein HYPSUDRAFT_64202 [Hypholoma sublateritium FD-334 SS-4]